MNLTQEQHNLVIESLALKSNISKNKISISGNTALIENGTGGFSTVKLTENTIKDMGRSLDSQKRYRDGVAEVARHNLEIKGKQKTMLEIKTEAQIQKETAYKQMENSYAKRNPSSAMSKPQGLPSESR